MGTFGIEIILEKIERLEKLNTVDVTEVKRLAILIQEESNKIEQANLIRQLNVEMHNLLQRRRPN